MPAVRRPILAAAGVLLAVALATSPALAAPPAIPALPAAAPSTVTESGDELIPNGDFTDVVDPWWTTPDTEAALLEGALCVDAPGGGGDPWTTIVGVDGIPWSEGESYRLAFRASGTEARTIRVLAQMDQGPWTSTYEMNPTMTPAFTEYSAAFTSTLDWPQGGQLVFQIGGSTSPWTFCLDDVSLTTGPPPEDFVHTVNSRVRVNQHGYAATGPQRATVLSDATAPLAWEVKDAAGRTVASGESEVFGVDESVASGVHRVDFTGVRETGEGFTLTVDGETSHPFAIGGELYAPLARDAMRYFLLARSGVELLPEFAGDAYARPAGHAGVAPNQGDTAVGCQQPRWWYSDWTCDREFDVSGGWYDAGDHGKYVVNGGIAVHQLLDVWERAERSGVGEELFGDASLNLPESGEGVPDVLSEARWELEWMLRMRVPDDMQYGGLYFHKVQDDAWTGLPQMPWLDDRPRQVHRPSTAATLNVAAVAAKGARLFEPYDAAFADELLTAGEEAWDAALTYPDRFAVARDGDDGGGPYDDDELDDEFFWAAVELALTTGDRRLPRGAVRQPPVAAVDARRPLRLEERLLAGSHRPRHGRQRPRPSDLDVAADAREKIVAAADEVLDTGAKSAFGHLYLPPSARYEWGSNGLVLNTLVVVATAYDITGERRYRDAVFEGMDYVLGRNGVDMSYITGYGAVASENQHHRWMAPSLDAALPPIPPGTLAGGANSSIQDPVAQRLWPNGCAGQLCYIDDIQSWSTNEMTINWNSALSWVAAWLAAEEAVDAAESVRATGTATGWWIAAGALALVAAAAVAVVIVRRRSTADRRGDAD